MINNWPEIIQNWMFPPTCTLCGDPGAAGLDLCAACAAALPRLAATCPLCGLPLTATDIGACGICQKTPPPFDSLQSAFAYEEPVRFLIQSLKFGAHYPHARLLGSLLAGSVATAGSPPEVIIPVPLHPLRYRERGFNQALEISRTVSEKTGIAVDFTCCHRLRETGSQTRLTARSRRKNVRNAFGTHDKRIPYRHVAILDDVVTTAATVGALAATLRRAGAERIDVWACARALR
jgi:ComF family protein